jgi:hypothetical protein
VFIYDCEKGRDEGLDYERNGTGLCDWGTVYLRSVVFSRLTCKGGWPQCDRNPLFLGSYLLMPRSYCQERGWCHKIEATLRIYSRT